jgi:Fe-S-cluster-containing dehydrogenase component
MSEMHDPSKREAALVEHAARWRGLDELDPRRIADADADATPPEDDVSRRGFMQLLGASMALAGLAGCTRAPRGKIVPYAAQPPEAVPGVAQWYATSTSVDGYAIGLLARSNEGRPTKIEGNARHPASLGATSAREQALVLGLYDPARARAIAHAGRPAAWHAFVRAVTAPRANDATPKETHVVFEPTSSPTLVDAIARLRRADPSVRVHYHAPLSRRAAWEGARLAFGRVLDTRIDLAKADVVVALDADILAMGPTHLADARAFAERRRAPDATHATRTTSASGAPMNRLYVVESALTVTGMAADHRLRVRTRDVRAVATALLGALLAGPSPPGANSAREAARALAPDAHGSHGPHDMWINAVARDLRAHAGASLVVAGDAQPPEVHALAHAMNTLLGNGNRTVSYVEPVIFEAGEPSHDLVALTRAIDSGVVDRLVFVGGNAAYTAPADLELTRRIRFVPLTAYAGLYENETASACAWFLPLAHDLESWGDARALDGTVTIQQPLIAPLYDGRTPAEIAHALRGDASADAHALVSSQWREHSPAGFDAFFHDALETGAVASSASPLVTAEIDWPAIARIIAVRPEPAPPLDVAFRADLRVHDGRFTENAWLLELPDPVTKLTWDNAALVSPKTAARLGLATEDVVDIEVRGRTVRAAVLVVPAHADDELTLPLGYGRTAGGALAIGVGFDAFALRTSASPLFDAGAIKKRADKHALAVTQSHFRIDDRAALAPSHDVHADHADHAHPPQKKAAHDAETPTLYQLRAKGEHQWGMTIDLAKCTGCSACVVACQAENNVPVVGKGNVIKSREMHWIRIDRYFVGDEDEPVAVSEPMACQHCEKAPCEYVCPVGATVHSADGMNDMVYNRCVGTRFCSNNCPYKVRRFNFFDYHQDTSATEALVMNPNVTVRDRGVMEKCTYCVQRVREVEIRARGEQRPIADGEIVTACQEACPSRAIVFGDTRDPQSAVSKSRADERAFAVLHELGAEPRTRYLARITNPNPELAKK